MTKTDQDDSYLVGDGPELFRISAGNENYQIIDPFGEEPAEPPRYLLRYLPEELRASTLERRGEIPTSQFLEAGVEQLNWRQPPRHIEGNLISDDVFAALTELAPGSVSSLGTLRLGWWNDRPYHLYKFHGFPEDDLLGELDARDSILLAQSEPPIAPNDPDSFKDPVLDAEFEARKSGQSSPVLALASWMARDDKIIYPGKKNPCVTDGFLRRWRETDISKMLWADNFEHDFYFRPWTYGARYQGGIPYKWVDVPG